MLVLTKVLILGINSKARGTPRSVIPQVSLFIKITSVSADLSVLTKVLIFGINSKVRRAPRSVLPKVSLFIKVASVSADLSVLGKVLLSDKFKSKKSPLLSLGNLSEIFGCG